MRTYLPKTLSGVNDLRARARIEKQATGECRFCTDRPISVISNTGETVHLFTYESDPQVYAIDPNSLTVCSEIVLDGWPCVGSHCTEEIGILIE